MTPGPLSLSLSLWDLGTVVVVGKVARAPVKGKQRVFLLLQQ